MCLHVLLKDIGLPDLIRLAGRLYPRLLFNTAPVTQSLLDFPRY